MGNDAPSSGSQFLHPRLGPATRLSPHMLIRLTLSNKYALSQWQAMNDKLRARLDPAVLLLPRSLSTSQRFMCNESVQVQIQFEYFPTSLQQELESRMLKESPFGEDQLWKLLTAMLEAAVCFQAISVRGADFRPCNVMLDSQGKIKMYSIFSSPLQKSGYFNMLHNQEPAYLSPEEYKQLNYQICTGIMRSFAQPAKSDSFSVSACLLEAMTLTPFSRIIRPEEGYMVSAEMQELISLMRKTPYSIALKELVESGLSLEGDRPLPSAQLAAVRRLQTAEIKISPFETQKGMSDSAFNKQSATLHIKRTVRK